MKDWLIIAVSGVTCGGKTSMCQKLKEVFPDCKLFNQDDYFLPEDSDRHILIEEVNHFNWDIISSLEMDVFHKDVLDVISVKPVKKPGLLIMEGHLVLNYRPLEQLCDLKYYVTLSKEQCWERRRIRTYQPPDPPGYFDICIWPMHEQYKKEIEESVQDIVFLDGTASTEENCNLILNDLKNTLQLWENTCSDH